MYINWKEIQKMYDEEEISERKICELFGISTSQIHRAKRSGYFKTRDKSKLLEIIIRKSKKRKQTSETKDKISKSRKEYLRNNPDKVPYLLNHSRNESYPEKYFTELFKKEGVEVDKKVRVGLYELDFSIPDRKIDIEIDGSQHYSDSKIIKSDKKRTKFLEDNGWDVIRINWASYKKMSFGEKNEYISELKSYIFGLIESKPHIEFIKKVKGKNTCSCGNLKCVRSKKCISCKNEIISISTKKRYNKKTVCIDCNDICNGKRCDKCYRLNSRKVIRPSYEQLLEEISEFGYCGTGRKYGVSDNCIRKWIKNYKN